MDWTNELILDASNDGNIVGWIIAIVIRTMDGQIGHAVHRVHMHGHSGRRRQLEIRTESGVERSVYVHCLTGLRVATCDIDKTGRQRRNERIAARLGAAAVMFYGLSFSIIIETGICAG